MNPRLSYGTNQDYLLFGKGNSSLYGRKTKHHRMPKMLGGTLNGDNRANLNETAHSYWHYLVGNTHPTETVQVLNKVMLGIGLNDKFLLFQFENNWQKKFRKNKVKLPTKKGVRPYRHMIEFKSFWYHLFGRRSPYEIATIINRKFICPNYFIVLESQIKAELSD